MRLLSSVLLCVALPAFAATSEDPIAVRRLIDSGAVELALTRIEALQPSDNATAGWPEWEVLRCAALARLNRTGELLARAAALPAASAPAARDICLLEAARAALVQNDPSAARAYAARALWQGKPDAVELKALRLNVIESYVAERRGEDAFRSMLRYQQDYQPLERGVAERFAEALLELGLDREALNWLGRSDEITPTHLRLQLRSGALTPDAVIAQARAALARTPDPGYWRAIGEAAAKTRNRSLEIEAGERLLQLPDARDARLLSESAKRLWQAYASTADEIGNREQLLVGDDGAWADYAARRLGSDPFLSRAFYGYLAQRGQNADIRRNAQLQLAFSLYSGGLDYTALRLLQHIGFEIESLDAQTRYLLGTIAMNRHESDVAWKLWNGLATPPNLNADEWEIRTARAALRAGDARASEAHVKQWLSGRRSLPLELAQAAMDLAQEMLDRRKLEAAQNVYELIAPLVNEVALREVVFGLGRVQELKAEYALSAASYLRAALLVQNLQPDALTFQARLLAGINLLRAGLKDDARAQFEWLLRNSKDAALIEAAKRGLAGL